MQPLLKSIFDNTFVSIHLHQLDFITTHFQFKSRIMQLKSYFLKHSYRYLKQSFPFITIIVIVDLLPLAAVQWWGWSAIEALYLYTLETLILLWITLRKMWRSKYVFALFFDQVQQVTDQIPVNKQVKTLWQKVPKFSWIWKGARGILYLVFTLLWLPLIALQLVIVSAVSGGGFGFWGFIKHDSGQLDLGFVSVNLLFVFLALLFIEHSYAYHKKFIKNKEYENTGFINEGLSFSIRVLIQQFTVIGFFALIGWMHIDNASITLIILFKTSMDIISYLFNRMWGGLKNKMERKGKQVAE